MRKTLLFLALIFPLTSLANSSVDLQNISCSGELLSSVNENVSLSCSGNLSLSTSTITSQGDIEISVIGYLLMHDVTIMGKNIGISGERFHENGSWGMISSNSMVINFQFPSPEPIFSEGIYAVVPWMLEDRPPFDYPISAVPEPKLLAMLGLGLGILGFTQRCRSKTKLLEG